MWKSVQGYQFEPRADRRVLHLDNFFDGDTDDGLDANEPIYHPGNEDAALADPPPADLDWYDKKFMKSGLIN